MPLWVQELSMQYILYKYRIFYENFMLINSCFFFPFLYFIDYMLF